MGVCGGKGRRAGTAGEGVGRRRACDTSPWRGCALCVESAALTQSSSHSRFVPVNTIVRAVVPPNTEITSASADPPGLGHRRQDSTVLDGVRRLGLAAADDVDGDRIVLHSRAT